MQVLGVWDKSILLSGSQPSRRKEIDMLILNERITIAPTLSESTFQRFAWLGFTHVRFGRYEPTFGRDHPRRAAYDFGVRSFYALIGREDLFDDRMASIS